MPQPTAEQEAVLNDGSRVRVVRAAPGSGKTWLIAEEIRRRLQAWPHRYAGIAALSFTNVARDEIASSVGSGLHHPHFVGTIDAFVFRYVVQPFAYVLDPKIAHPKLIPANVADILNDKQKWNTKAPLTVQVGPTTKDRDHLFKINAIGGDQNGDTIYHATYGPQREGVNITGAQAQYIFKLKRKIWAETGLMSHSDVTYLAAAILHSSPYGQSIIELIVRRFPVLIFDELQDTGFFLARAMHKLIENTSVSSLLVGDPDQAIYEFNGARPDLFGLFESIPDASISRIRKTRRCSPNVCSICNELSDAGEDTESDTIGAGAAVLICHADSPEDRQRLATALQTLPGTAMVRIVTRKTSTLHSLTGKKVPARPKFGVRPINHLHDAVNDLRRGDTKSALAKAMAAFGYSVFGADAPTDEMFSEKAINETEWKHCAVQLLLSAVLHSDDECLYTWGCKVKNTLEEMVNAKGWVTCREDWAHAPNNPYKALEGQSCSLYVAPIGEQAETRDLRMTTIHGAKGETHDVTVLYVPKTTKDKCPSNTWWSTDPDVREERRVAFVAASRPRTLFVLCAHQNTVGRLRIERPEFISLFQEIEIDDDLPDNLCTVYSEACK